jgi:hypothetical protein
VQVAILRYAVDCCCSMCLRKSMHAVLMHNSSHLVSVLDHHTTMTPFRTHCITAAPEKTAAIVQQPSRSRAAVSDSSRVHATLLPVSATSQSAVSTYQRVVARGTSDHVTCHVIPAPQLSKAAAPCCSQRLPVAASGICCCYCYCC